MVLCLLLGFSCSWSYLSSLDAAGLRHFAVEPTAANHPAAMAATLAAPEPEVSREALTPA